MAKNQPTQDQRYRWWGPERNALRRERYAGCLDYANRVRSQRRRSYRRMRGEPDLPSPTAQLANLDTICQVREVFDTSGRSLGKQLCCTISEVCTVLSRRGKTVERWIRSGRFPPTAFTIAPNHNQHAIRVFLPEEVVAAAHVLAEHFAEVAVLRADHTATIGRLADAVAKVRRREKTASPAEAGLHGLV